MFNPVLFDRPNPPQSSPSSSPGYACSPGTPSLLSQLRHRPQHTTWDGSVSSQPDRAENRQQASSESGIWHQLSAFLNDNNATAGDSRCARAQHSVENLDFANSSSSRSNNTSFNSGVEYGQFDRCDPMDYRSGLHAGPSFESRFRPTQARAFHHHATSFTPVPSSSSSPAPGHTSRFTFTNGSANISTSAIPHDRPRPRRQLNLHQGASAPSRSVPTFSRSGSDPSDYQPPHPASFIASRQPVPDDQSQQFSATAAGPRPNNILNFRSLAWSQHASHDRTGSLNSAVSPRRLKRRLVSDSSDSSSTMASDQDQLEARGSLFGSPPPSARRSQTPHPMLHSHGVGRDVIEDVDPPSPWFPVALNTNRGSEERIDGLHRTAVYTRTFVRASSSDGMPHSSERAGLTRTLSNDERRNSGFLEQLRGTSNVAPSAVLLYEVKTSGSGSDVWPDVRDDAKAPARYAPLETRQSTNVQTRSQTRFPTIRKAHTEGTSLCPAVDGKGWPKGEVPAEIYGLIIRNLSRDDVKAMRLACKEFEKFTSHALFEAVVVPFNTEIYGMLGSMEPLASGYESKSKMTDTTARRASTSKLAWNNAKGDDVYTGHGLDVFRGFGPHILKYGMSFEVDESMFPGSHDEKSADMLSRSTCKASSQDDARGAQKLLGQLRLAF